MSDSEDVHEYDDKDVLKVTDDVPVAVQTPRSALQNLTLPPTVIMTTDDDSIEDKDHLLPSSAASPKGNRPLPTLTSPATYRDKVYTFLFILHIIIAVLATKNIRSLPERSKVSTTIETEIPLGQVEVDDRALPTLDASSIALIFHWLSVLSLLFTITWQLIFLLSRKKRLIVVSTAFSSIGLLSFTISLLSADTSDEALAIGIIGVFVVLVDFGWKVKFQSGFDFVAVLFDLVTDVLLDHTALLVVSTGVLVVYTIWVSWLCTTIAITTDHGVSPLSVSMLYLYFHFYWTSNVFKNIVTVVVAGTTMIWYNKTEAVEEEESPDDTLEVSDHIDPPEDEEAPSSMWFHKPTSMNRHVVFHYFRCSLTTSFGSICIGSLICPLSHFIWNVLRWATRDESSIRQKYSWLRSSRVEHLIKSYHKYSFAHIAGYSKPFYAAAHDTWQLMQARGVEAIVDDDLTSRSLFFISNGWAGLIATIALLTMGTQVDMPLLVSGITFVASYSAVAIAVHLVGGVIKTLFVCFAEHPTRLSQLHPLIYHRFVRVTELKSFHEGRSPV